MPRGIYKRSLEHRRKIGLIHKGKKLTEEHKRKISDNHGEYSGKDHWKWKNGVWTEEYVWILKKEHPNCTKRGYVKRSRLVMEDYLGRYLTKEERVHHINFNKHDDSIENLMLFPNESEHQKYHHILKKVIHGGGVPSVAQ
jgi:hypothetical protein